MNEEYLRNEIEKLEAELALLKGDMRRALNYSKDDPNGALNKTRIILEKIVKDVYRKEMNQEPDPKAMLGSLISPNEKTKPFRDKIDSPILNQIFYLQKMGNFGSHDNPDPITVRQAVSSLNTLCDIIDWYLEKYVGRVKEKNQDGNTNSGIINNHEKTKIVKQIHNIRTTINGTLNGTHHLGVGNINIQEKK